MKNLMSVIGALAVLGVGAAQGQLSAEQQKCVAVVNKDAIKVLSTQSKLALTCAKRAPTMAEACIAADADGKVQRAVDKALAHDAAYCLDPPAFAYLTAGTAAAVAKQVSTDAVRDVVGSPIDSGLACTSSPDECFCQLRVISKVGKMLDAANKLFVKCKRVALATATAAADVAACVTDGGNPLSLESDPKGTIAKRRGQIVATLAKYCNALSSDPFVGGACPGANGPTGADCLRDRVLCRACQFASEADGLGIDCNAWSGSNCS